MSEDARDMRLPARLGESSLDHVELGGRRDGTVEEIQDEASRALTGRALPVLCEVLRVRRDPDGGRELFAGAGGEILLLLGGRLASEPRDERPSGKGAPLARRLAREPEAVPVRERKGAPLLRACRRPSRDVEEDLEEKAPRCRGIERPVESEGRCRARDR